MSYKDLYFRLTAAICKANGGRFEELECVDTRELMKMLGLKTNSTINRLMSQEDDPLPHIPKETLGTKTDFFPVKSVKKWLNKRVVGMPIK